MTFLRLSLRDLLWLVLLAATLTAAWREREQATARLDKLKGEISPLILQNRKLKPTKKVLRVDRAYRESLRGMTDTELIAAVPQSKVERFNYWEKPRVEYDYWLAEMARRGLVKELAAHYAEVALKEPELTEYQFDYSCHDLEPLTALRRAQGHRDPLSIRVWIEADSKRPILKAALVNADVDQRRFVLRRGRDAAQWRHERWTILLTDRSGRRLPLSYDHSYGDDAIGSIGPLEFGEVGRTHAFDLRDYVMPPPSGVYRIQLLYHDVHALAPPSDSEGLICSQSEPLTIRVTNHDQVRSMAIVVAVITALCAGVCLMFRRAGQAVWLDVVWCLVVLSVVVAWYVGQQQLEAQIREQRVHASAPWTIEAVQD